MAILSSTAASADEGGALLPPWTDPGDVPLPGSVQSVAPKRGDMIILSAPSRFGERRGISMPGARLPLFGAKRARGCNERWLLVGPMAWVCGDFAELSMEDPLSLGVYAGEDGLPYRYFFTGRDGALAYARLEYAGDDAPDRELESGWAVAIVDQASANGTRWGKTNKGLWISMRDLYPARPSAFHGEEIADGKLDLAWVKSETAYVFAAPAGGVTGSRVRFQRVGYYEEKNGFARISEDGAQKQEWMLARDLAHPTPSEPPPEVGGKDTTERWIDVHLASQTIVAYERTRPVYATLVSSGRGPPNSITPVGVERIWVKLTTGTMDDVEREDVTKHYSMEDVPWVMYFNKSVALHGAFWHRDFGHVHSHGCVNLAPIDARWIFQWTSPHMPPGWIAAYPTSFEKGTAVRVR